MSARISCAPDAVARYRGRVSGPLLDRIDLQVEVARQPTCVLASDASSAEGSLAVRARVLAARERQLARAGTTNSALAARELERDCALGAAEQRLLQRAIDQLQLSARAYHRILRVARTLADLCGAALIDAVHLAEAVSYRRAAG